jgi:outer membrane protein TolC
MSLVLAVATREALAQQGAPPPDLVAIPQEPAAPEQPPSPAPSAAQETPSEAATEAEQAVPEALLRDESERPAPGASTISLAEAVAVALEHNYTLLSANDSVLSARFRERAAFAQFYPRLTPRYQQGDGVKAFGADLSQRLPWLGGTILASGTLSDYDATAAGAPAGKGNEFRAILNQPLLRGFGPNTTFYDLRNSQRSRVAQERFYTLAKQRLAIDVTSAYYQIVRQRALLGVSRQSLKRSDTLRDASNARMQVGLASKLDVFRAELQSSQTQESLVQSRAALDNALEGFRLVLGLAPSEPVEPEDRPLSPDDASLEIEPTDALVAKALENRLELQEARDQIHDAERTLSLTKQNLLPQLDLNLSVTKIGFGPSYGDAIDSSDTRWNLSFSSSYPLERSNDRAAKAIAELDLAARKRSVTQREQEVEAEVRNAVRSLERLKQSIALQRKSVEFSAQQLRLATLRYQRGLASNFDVVDAEGSLVSARTALVGLLTDFQVARVQLLRTVGTLDVGAEFLK